MRKPITGTWFEFWHHNLPEGKYWNETCRALTEEQWRTKFREMREMGMEYIVLTASSMVYEDRAESYFPTDIYPAPVGMVCPNPMDVLMDEAEKLGIRVFISCGWYGVWTRTEENMESPEVTARAFQAAREIYERYRDNASFCGWYLPDETHAGDYFSRLFIDYVNKYAKFLRALSPDKLILIAPYGTKDIVADETFTEELRELDCDIVAYQDEVGVRKASPEQTGEFYRALRACHDAAGKSRIWADMEAFDFEGEVYKSALVPANIDRLRRQIEAISPHVERILCYCFMGIMDKPGSAAPCGRADAAKYYEDYARLLKSDFFRS